MNQEALHEVRYIEVSDPAVMTLVPIVSVSMITYNHGPYLAEAIEGVIAQKTDFPIELVISEDCSTDNTREIALDYQRRYPHLIRVIYSNHNIGMRRNFRRVLNACRGELIAFCEGDDYWIDPEKLREQVAVLSKFKNIDITFHSCYLKYDKQSKEVLSNVHYFTDKVFTLSEVIRGDGGFMPSASIVFRRSLLISFQDWLNATMPPVGDYFLQVFGSQSGGAYYMNKPMCVYRKEVEGAWSEIFNKTDALVEFEKRFYTAIRKLEQAIPGQEEAFHCFIVSHYSARFTEVTNENFAQIKALILSVLKDLYKPKSINDHGIVDEQLEWDLFLKLAVDSGKTKDLADQKCGVFWQFCRVAKSFIDYGILVLKMINTNLFNSSNCEMLMAKWKMEEQSSYLIARWKRFSRLVIEKVRLVLAPATGTFLPRRKY